MLECVFEGREIVEFDDTGSFGGIYWRADVATAWANDAVFERGEGFIYRAVIAVMEDKNFVSAA